MQARGLMANWTRHAFAWSVVVGLACIAVKFLAWLPFRHVIIQEVLPGASDQFEAVPRGPAEIAWLLLENGWVGPILEGVLFFAVVWWLFLGLKLKGKLGASLYVVILGVLSWAVHGAGLNNVGHGLAFALLAGWFWAVAQTRGGWVAFATNVVAHGVWNTTLIAVWLVRNGV